MSLSDSMWIIRRKVAAGVQSSIHKNTEPWQLLHSRFLIRSPSSPSHNPRPHPLSHLGLDSRSTSWDAHHGSPMQFSLS